MSKKKHTEARKTLLTDLEAIHRLLSETPMSKKKPRSAAAKPIPPEAAQDDVQVPLLDDMIETPSLSEEEKSASPTVLGDGLFEALLTEDWSTSTAKILEQAVESIAQQRLAWTPTLTDELVDALKVRIDETVHAWLQTVIVRQAEELQSTILEALSQEIASTIKRLSDNQNSEGADGD